jgi:phosphoglucomutase
MTDRILKGQTTPHKSVTNYRDLYQRWLDSPALSEAEWQELSAVGGDEEEIESRFAAPLAFGTAGLRGVMGVGLNRMNIHVVRLATQAFASVIAEGGPPAMEAGAVICYDCRENSELFAREAASVMAANGVKVRLFDAMRPTPELSFAIRHYGAAAGVNITASHNPKEYSGYKVYWSDGAQLPPKHAEAIAERMRTTDIFSGPKRCDFDEAAASGLITFLGAETDEAFLEKVMAQSIDPEAVRAVADRFSVVYTPFHGTGYALVPEALRRLGLTRLYPVPEQMVIDGSFPTVKSPNPENPEGFRLGIELARKIGSDLIIGTDPDADRVGVLVRRGEDFVPVTGNQTGVLLLDYIIRSRRAGGTLPENAAVIKTIVSTAMAREVAERNGVHTDETFTGFKFMAEKLCEYEETGSYSYLLAFEESYGYMMGDYVRDKDGVTASMLITEMAASYFRQGMSLLDAMDALYTRYGWFGEQTLNLVMPGVDGQEKMGALMRRLRENPPAEIGGEPVLKLRDYLTGEIRISGLGIVDKTEISGSNVLYFELADGSVFIVRPSGTEPKLKVYLLVRGEDAHDRDDKLRRYAAFAEELGK